MTKKMKMNNHIFESSLSAWATPHRTSNCTNRSETPWKILLMQSFIPVIWRLDPLVRLRFCHVDFDTIPLKIVKLFCHVND